MQSKFQIDSVISLPPQSLLKKLLQGGEERTFYFLSQVPKKQKSTFSIHAKSLWERLCQLSFIHCLVYNNSKPYVFLNQFNLGYVVLGESNYAHS